LFAFDVLTKLILVELEEGLKHGVQILSMEALVVRYEHLDLQLFCDLIHSLLDGLIGLRVDEDREFGVLSLRVIELDD
jgi:hypothetical protein